MSPRQKRIEKIVAHRQKELDGIVGQLAAQKARELAAQRTAEAADEATRQAEVRRRELGQSGTDAMTFLEAGDWLDTASRHAMLAWAEVRNQRQATAKIQQLVISAKMKLKQAEHLSSRVALAERRVVERKERRRDDEDAARIAQRRSAGALK
jgi:hypothetical protein